MLIKPTVQWMLFQENKLHNFLEAWAVNTALPEAVQSFTQAYPRWANSLFDQYFLTHKAATMLIHYNRLTRDHMTTELAKLWLSEMGPRATQHHQPEAEAAAGAFLQCLEAKLGPPMAKK